MPSVEALKACSLLKGFTDTGLQILTGIITDRSFPEGTPLFVESMVGDSMLIIVQGRVRLSSKKPSGEQVTVGEVGPGDHLGELSLIQTGQRLCTATAASAVIAAEIRHADFHKLLAQKPQACLKLLMAIVGQFGQRVFESREVLKSLL
jgi:CRP/FNR family transcriptional regulator, cyclic AMP receptor protein